MSIEENEILTPDQAAKLLQLKSKRSIYELVTKNQFPYFKICNQIRIPKELLMQYINKLSQDNYKSIKSINSVMNQYCGNKSKNPA
jgi:excisionase family DNA binding protein